MSDAVCHVVYGRFPADPRVRRETLALKGAGYHVDVICVVGEGEPSAELWQGIHVRRLPMRVVRGSRSRYVFQYALHFAMTAIILLASHYRRRYKVIHVHSLPDFLVFAALPCRLLGASLILDLHESFPELLLARFPGRGTGLLLRIVRIAQVLSCRVASHVLTVNQRIRNLLVKRRVREMSVSIVENSPDWPTSVPEVGVGTSESGLLPQRIVVAAGLNKERDFATLLRAAELVRRTIPIELHLYGRGDPRYVREISDLARTLGLDGSFRLMPEVPAEAVPDLLRNTTIGVVTYERNPLTQLATPNKVYEYSALGKPMVVADLEAIRELLGDSALYYEPGNSFDLSSKILRILTNAFERERLGFASREFARLHSWVSARRTLLLSYTALGSRP